MKLKSLILSAAAAALTLTATAQDKIYKTDGTVIEAKIKTVGTKTVTYSRYDNQNGPEYTILKVEVNRITYQSGGEDVFEGRTARAPRRPGPHRPHSSRSKADRSEPAAKDLDYGASVLALAPLQFTDNGLGLSLSYETSIEKNGIVTFYLPVAATFNLSNRTYTNYTTGLPENGRNDAMYYAMPGVKVYPTGCYGKVRYSVGPSLVIGVGQRSTSVYDYNTGLNTYTTYTKTQLGMIVNNTLNINASAHIYMGLELGLGFTYLNKLDGVNQNTTGLVQGSFKLGYRF